VIGGRIVAEYDSLSKKVAQMYTMKEMVLPEDETKIFNETLVTRLEDTNQQLKKWMTRWRPVIDHSMKRVKELHRRTASLYGSILRQTNQQRQEYQENSQQENTQEQ
jgi:hypothetical protein